MKTTHRRYAYVDVNDTLSRDSRQFISVCGFSWPQTADTSATICIIIITWDITDTQAGKTQSDLKFSRTKRKSLVAGAHCGVPASIPGQFVGDLWWTK